LSPFVDFKSKFKNALKLTLILTKEPKKPEKTNRPLKSYIT